MSAAVLQVACAVAFVAGAALLAHRLQLGLSREIVIAAVRAIVQLTAVGALIALVFEIDALALAFVAVMVVTATLTSGGRIKGVPEARRRAGAAIGAPALGAAAILIAVGAFEPTPREVIPVAGILTGGAMIATTLTGRRLLEGLHDDADAIETRLALGDRLRTALAPTVRTAIRTGVVPVIDQTRNVGLVTLPGTFVGLVLGGASPAEAARVQLTVLLTLVAVELAAATVIAELIVRTRVAPGERLTEEDQRTGPS
ncbi:MAG TPA: ABC transporter permease [Solirubrobacter sp.]|nr:ABC transporter permease [Solirubrobacter sp.]